MTPSDREHQWIGFLNPRCARCGQTPMQVVQAPRGPCRLRMVPVTAPRPRAEAPQVLKEPA